MRCPCGAAASSWCPDLCAPGPLAYSPQQRLDGVFAICSGVDVASMPLEAPELREQCLCVPRTALQAARANSTATDGAGRHQQSSGNKNNLTFSSLNMWYRPCLWLPGVLSGIGPNGAPSPRAGTPERFQELPRLTESLL